VKAEIDRAKEIADRVPPDPVVAGAGIDEEGRFRGGLKSTGIRPSFSEKLSDYGIALEPSLFAAAPAPFGNGAAR
jgi:hypothetical protein